jgi:hypothetical protein
MTGYRFHIAWLIGITAMLCCLPLSTGSDDGLLKPFSATFNVKRNLMPLGDLKLELSLLEQGGYRYSAHTLPGLLAGWFSGDEIIEESQGRLHEAGVQPFSYSYSETGNEKEDAVLEFDWSAQEVHTTSGGVTWSQSITDGAQDRLSQQLLVRLHLAEGKRDITYRVADGGKIKRYRFFVEGEDTLETPYGELDCLRVRRSKESRKPDYTIWFAPQLDYLPVRIERKRSGRLYRMALEEITFQPDHPQR